MIHHLKLYNMNSYYLLSGKHIHIFFVKEVRKAFRRGLEIQQSAAFGLLDPAFVVSVSIEQDTLVISDGFLDKLV